MVESMQQIELQKLQLVNSLTQTAEALRNAASMAESFAAALHTTALSPGGSSSSTQSPLLNLFPNFANSGLPSQLQQQLQQQGHSSAASQLSQQIIQHLAQQSDQLLQQQQGTAAGQKKEEPTRRKRKPASAADGDEKVTRKKRVKDPDAPKRPPSAYLLFQNEVRKEMVKQHDGLPYHEVLAEISKRWSEMSDEQKRVYNEATSKAKIKYEVNKAAYEQQKLAQAKDAEESMISPIAEASSPEEEEGSDEETSPVAPPSKTNGAKAKATKEDSDDSDAVEEHEAEEDSDAEPEPDVAASPVPVPAKAAIPAHVLQTPANKKTVAAVPHSVPAIAAIRTMDVDTETPAGGKEKREKEKSEKKEKEKKKRERKKKGE